MAALLAGTPRVRVIGRSIAVMPFVNVTGCATVDTFSDSLSEEIASALREFDGIVVAPGASVLPNDSDLHLSHASRLVGGDVVLFGSARRSADGTDVLISASLFDARDGRRIWSGASTCPHRGGIVELSSPARHFALAVANALGRGSTRATHAASDARSLSRHNGFRIDANGRSAAR